ncbi:NADPH-dependent FMN reductase [Halobacillus sp. BBL2006]|uniref:NADPH-dependent FMN reductase n=1 Tax=Halobacillus sp. BBL2006 TaxID=1543706 RepID=UPI000543363E|nr:NADPH-dependent FMN reductase [Halobacillus sp. BBL2006]KHE68852.1 hypothetical protein LD39_13790 [Halobacillus sp. BBL2006]
MNIIVISGTPRRTGRTRVAARLIAEQLGADLVDLSELCLPFFNGEKEQEESPEVQQWKRKAHKADAFVWLTPEYHNGMSAVLKNALEFLDAESFRHKPTLLFSVAGGGKGGINALNQMRTIGRGLRAHVVPEQFVFDPHCFVHGQGFTREASEKVSKIICEFNRYIVVKS